MEVQGQHPIGPGGGNQVGHQAGRDGNPGLVFLVGAPVAVVRDDGGDAAGRRPLAGVNHNQQLHQVVVGGRHGGLDDEHVALADVLADTDEGVVIGELERLALAQGDAQVAAHVLGQLGMRVAGEHLQFGFVEHGHKTTFA